LLVLWHDPPPAVPDEEMSTFSDNTVVAGAPSFPINRKPSTSTISDIPPLAHSLELLYLGENSFTDEVLHPLMILKELRVLNLSFNDIQDIPSHFFRHLTKLEEVYLSGNGLTNFPSEDLPKLTRLSTLFLNGNRLQTLPQELGKVKSLTVLDVGSNLLKYNINNWEFDWNWWVFLSALLSLKRRTHPRAGTLTRACGTSICRATNDCRSSRMRPRLGNAKACRR
jgi:adenylate cyclase